MGLHVSKRRTALLGSALLLILFVGIVILIVNKKPQTAIPVAIQNQVSFVVLVPGNKDVFIEQSSISYSKASGVLSFTVSYNQAHAEITITQQAAPSIFTDVPQYYPTLVDKLNEYASLGTVNGTVYLTKPTELKGQQEAVLNNYGTLLFAHLGDRNLSNDDWRRFFNELQVLKP